MGKRIDSNSKVQQELEIVILEKFLEKEKLSGVEHNDKMIFLKRKLK